MAPSGVAAEKPTKKKKRTSSETAGGGAVDNKKKLYCICRTPYDNTKFYVGCDICSNWFHGDCVGITEAMSHDMDEFICDDCRQVQQEHQVSHRLLQLRKCLRPSSHCSLQQEKEELYCLCRQPYDETQFYICCDTCQDWFHGRCVGVLQAESDSIDEYRCPNCDPQSLFNYANTRTLAPSDYEKLNGLLRQLQTHKSSWPFRVPVNQRDVPDYYQVIMNAIFLSSFKSTVIRTCFLCTAGDQATHGLAYRRNEDP